MVAQYLQALVVGDVVGDDQMGFIPVRFQEFLVGWQNMVVPLIAHRGLVVATFQSIALNPPL